jgi:hypothetical protein
MSIQEKAILIDLTLTTFSTSRTDKSVTQEVTYNKGAGKQAGKWTTKILPKHATQAIAQHDGRIRKFHYTNTLPWSDKGARMLPARNFDNYMATMRSLRRERDELVEHFTSHYQQHLDEARQVNAALYNPAHYPTAHEAGERYSMQIQPAPVPDKGDFRVTLSNTGDLQAIQQQLEQQVHQAVKAAEADLLSRLLEPLQNMAEKLSDPDTKFKDTLVTNLADIVAIIPTLNITDNPNLTIITQLIEQQLAHFTPDTLRHSPADRAIAARKAQEIATQASSWMA